MLCSHIINYFRSDCLLLYLTRLGEHRLDLLYNDRFCGFIIYGTRYDLSCNRQSYRSTSIKIS